MKSSNKLNRSAEPNSKLWFRHRASSVLSSNRSTTYELSKSSYFVLLFSSLIGYFVTSNCTLLPLLLWLAFWSASVWNTRYGSSSRTSYSALCAYSGQVAGFFIDSSQIVEQFHPGKRLVLFDWCLLFYWLLADRGAVLCRETIGFVWLIFLVARLCILYWLLALCADFVNVNSWFCLNDILTVIVSVLVRWKNAMSKKRHLAEGFSPDAIAGRLAEKNAYTRGSGRYCSKITTFRLFIDIIEQYNALQETVTFTDKKKIAYNYSDPGGTRRN